MLVLMEILVFVRCIVFGLVGEIIKRIKYSHSKPVPSFMQNLSGNKITQNQNVTILHSVCTGENDYIRVKAMTNYSLDH